MGVIRQIDVTAHLVGTMEALGRDAERPFETVQSYIKN